MERLCFDAPGWLAAAAGPGRPWVAAAIVVVVLADHRHLRRLARRGLPSRPPQG